MVQMRKLGLPAFQQLPQGNPREFPLEWQPHVVLPVSQSPQAKVSEHSSDLLGGPLGRPPCWVPRVSLGKGSSLIGWGSSPPSSPSGGGLSWWCGH